MMVSLAFWLFLFPSVGWGHEGVHSSIDIVFLTDADAPVVVSNWGFFQQDTNGWRWLCPEALGTLDLYTLAIDSQNTWWIGTLDGLWSTENQCTFDMNHFAGQYVADIEVEGTEIWLSTATGFSENALWYSNDFGQSFSAVRSFGLGARIYSIVVEESMIWVLSAIDGDFTLWWQRDGADWQYRVLPELQGWVDIVGKDPELPDRIWLSATLQESELWRLDIESGVRNLLQTEKKFQGIETINGWILVGGESGFYASQDGGDSWTGPWLEPEVVCLEKHGDYLYVCSHNWQDDAAVMRTLAQGEPSVWEWEVYFSFGEVYDLMDCPVSSTTELECSQYWDAGVLNGGFAAELPTPDQTDSNDCQGCVGEQKQSLVLLGLFGMIRRKSASQIET